VAREWRVTRLSRRGRPTDIHFELGAELPSASLPEAKALIHCAYDFGQLSWSDTHRVNVAGTEALFRAARAAGVERLVYISSISAFDGCRSLYGKAKLETEGVARSFGATIIRPGLIWGASPGAMFKRLSDQVQHGRIIPLIGGGSQVQYLVHDEDLSAHVCGIADGTLAAPDGPLTIAHEQPWTFRQILEALAAASGRSVTFVPVPWRMVWGVLKLAESARVQLPFRSDSVVSLVNQNPNPSFLAQRELGLVCRPFALTTTVR
jgi:nucleoside-diphosphate-sugar epimerase